MITHFLSFNILTLIMITFLRQSILLPSIPVFNVNLNHWLSPSVLVRSAGDGDSVMVSSKSIQTDGVSSVKKKDTDEKLEILWDDGFGTQSIDDCIEIAMDLYKSYLGPPRWFCPIACGKPIKDSPVLLYLPGIDGTGTGLVVQEKALGKVFKVQCLHIPVWDRTPLEGLFQVVEEILMNEHKMSPNKPIYLLGESFGGALALAIAARNPTLDLILILVNPATSYERSQLRSLPSLVEDMPEEYYWMLPYAMIPFAGDYIKMAKVKSHHRSHMENLCHLLADFSKHLPLLSVVPKILLPKDTLTWRLKLAKSVAAYANSRLHVITSQVLVLASGKDNVLPSKDEALRLLRSLKHCDVRVFEENGHSVLLESGVNVLTSIKTTYMYRRSSKHDILKDFLPISITEFKSSPVETWWFRLYIDAVMFSTMEDGKIVRGLAGIPDEGPVLIVGNHMLMGFDVFSIVTEFWKEKKLTLHGLAHPELFHVDIEREYYMIPITDLLKVGGSIPVSGRNFFNLLAKKSHVLLYPGGIREALHRKGEAGKLFWPDKQEFVRMAVRFGATIVPYGGVGEDDILDLVIDYNDMKRNPLSNHMVNSFNQGRKNLREGVGGEIAEQPFHIPLFLPKPPGRLYFKFGKPIQTKGNEHMLNDKDYLQDLYFQIRCEVEKNMDYLLKKREEDPYRSGVKRFVWQMKYGSLTRIPSFNP